MTYIESYDSPEEAMEAVHKRVEEAKKLIRPSQRPLMDGKSHYWMRLYLLSEEGPMIIICGKTIDLRKHAEMLHQRYPEDCPSVEDEYLNLKSNLDNGFITGYAYSEMEPDGEWGDTHVSTVMEINEELFNQFKAQEWRATTIETQDAALDWINEVHTQ